MDFKKFGNFNWIKTDSKDQNLDLKNHEQNEFISVHFNSFSFHACILSTVSMIDRVSSLFLIV